ncbi:MAG TPA: SGNH/GDSL hydrolase family protein [Rhizobacter sp.]|nr:SGNH/GDSL hydrolase family protein [Rhizobacter sp.]
MKFIRFLGVASAAALLLTACGGGGDGDQSPRVRYSAMVSFGDSLSDVGTYGTATLKAATGGGKYTVNGPAGKNWTELVSAQLGTGAPCAAQTGLESSGPLAAFAEPITNHAACRGYAQGGARVTNPVGPGNKALIALGDTGGYVGQMTVPVVTQINNHLSAVGGRFSGSELVTVMAGGNDVFINLAAVSGGQATPTQAVTAMGQAGAELAGYIKALILANGATHVVVVNLPDVSQTPLAYAQSAEVQGLINMMVTTFNTQLHTGLAGTTGVLEVDAYTQGRDQVANPATYGLTNVTTPACDLTRTVFASSLVCSGTTLIAGDTSRYEFADSVHPTPYGYQLLAQFVTKRMIESGWL